jgi:SAM-dependent methyltransferase
MKPELWFPLRLRICERCWLAQTEDYAGRDDLFSANYAYFSSFSSSWLAHARDYVGMAIRRFALGPDSMVVEVAANDGYLLQYVREAGIRCYGIEPTASTAAAARKKGIHIVEEFFGVDLADRLSGDGRKADLIAANNVLAHVPDINDFVAGFARLLNPGGVATFEFPHLLPMIAECQFDTVYHEHYSYLSLSAVRSIFATNGLAVFDVEKLSTHGGSLRVFAQLATTGKHPESAAVEAVLNEERSAGVLGLPFYQLFQQSAEKVKNEFLKFLLDARGRGQQVAGYGAAAKGNTLLNFSGVRSDLLRYIVDRNPAKQNQYAPGCRIPIVAEQRLREDRPDVIVVFPRNLMPEVREQLSYVREWGARLVTVIPDLLID